MMDDYTMAYLREINPVSSLLHFTPRYPAPRCEHRGILHRGARTNYMMDDYTMAYLREINPVSSPRCPVPR